MYEFMTLCFSYLKRNLKYYLFELFYSLIFILVHIFSESVIYIFSTNHIPHFSSFVCFKILLWLFHSWLFSGSPVLSSVRFNHYQTCSLNSYLFSSIIFIYSFINFSSLSTSQAFISLNILIVFSKVSVPESLFIYKNSLLFYSYDLLLLGPDLISYQT